MKAGFFDKIIAGGMLCVIAFTALAHGAVESWSAAIFELMILLLLFLWVIKSLIEKNFELNLQKVFFPIAALLALGLIQIFSFRDSAGNLTSLSIDREATASAVKALFFLLAAYLIVSNFFNTKEKLLSLVKFFTLFGLLLAVFALLQYFTWNGNLYWLIPINAGKAEVVGPFVNHNHFAGFLELLIPLPIALIVTGALKQYRVLLVFAAAMMAIAIVASLSRGGIVSLACGLLFTFLIGFVYKRRLNDKQCEAAKNERLLYRQKVIDWLSGLAIVSIILGAIFIGTMWVGMDPVIDRLSNNAVFSEDEAAPTFEDSRGRIWQTSLKIFYSNPVSGIGLGAYGTAYPNYSEKDEPYVIDRAHNDYLQVLTDGGVIGGLIALWFIGIFILNTARFLRQDLDPVSAGIAVGSAAGVFSLLIHSIFDFNLQIPANALVFLVLTGVFSQIVSQKSAALIPGRAETFVRKKKALALGASA